MKRTILILIALLGLALPVGAQTCTTVVDAPTWTTTGSESVAMTSVTLTNMAAGVACRELTMTGSHVLLERVVMTSTNGTDIDIVVSESATSDGTAAIYSNDGTDLSDPISAVTIDNVAYTAYLNSLPWSRGVMAGTTSARKLWLRVDNNDAGTRTVKVRLYWKRVL